MKKIFSTLLLIVLFANAHALYLGNPDSPDAVPEGFFIPEDAFIGVKAGYQVDYVFDKGLKSYAGASARVDQFQAMLNQGVITFDLVERIEVYGSVGAMEASFSHRPGPEHYRREYQTNDKLTWGVGGRILIYQWREISLGLAGGFQWANPDIKWDSLNGEAFTTGAKMLYREWQVGLGISRTVDMFIPYGAIKYSNVSARVVSLRSNLDLDTSHFRMTNRDHFGIVLGCTLTPGRYFDVTVESRMIDEQALTLAGNLRF
jgi:major outer membrane protein